MIAEPSNQDKMIERKTSWLKRGLVTVGALGVLVVGLSLVNGSHFLRAEPSVAYGRLRTAFVEQGALVRDIRVEGRIVASSFPTVFSPAKGKTTLHVNPGQKVEKEQVLAIITSPELMIQLKQEESTLDALTAQLNRVRIERKTILMTHDRQNKLTRLRLDAAQRAFNRAQQSRDQGLINAMEYEAAEDAVQIAEMELENGLATAALDEERLDFEIRNQEALVVHQNLVLEDRKRQVNELTIRSPVTGLVGNVDVDQSDWVNVNQPLMTVIDLSAFEVEIQIPEAYADDVTAEVIAEIHYMGKKYAGTVSRVAPEVQNSVVEGTVAFKDEIPQGLRQNQRVSTRLILARREGVTKVCRGPFLEEFGGRKVYKIEGDRAILSPIFTGMVCVGEIEIVEGLHAGDEVVLSDMSGFDLAQTIWLRR